jgi:hypothetical protein
MYGIPPISPSYLNKILWLRQYLFFHQNGLKVMTKVIKREVGLMLNDPNLG